MKVLAFVFSGLLGLLGLIFLAGHQGQMMRILVGLILLAAAIVLVVVVRLQPQVEQRNIVQKLHLSGDVSLEQMQCRQCAGKLNQDSVKVQAGAVFVACPYCGASYQLEEAPKW
jgi:hypothetical protein